MTTPGFTAEAALERPRSYGGRDRRAGEGAGSIVPQQGSSHYVGQRCYHGLMLDVYESEGHYYGVWVGSCANFP